MSLDRDNRAFTPKQQEVMAYLEGLVPSLAGTQKSVHVRLMRNGRLTVYIRSTLEIRRAGKGGVGSEPR